MSIPLPPGRTPEQLVDFVLAAEEREQDDEALVSALVAEFDLALGDAELAIDRVRGGTRFTTRGMELVSRP